MKFKKPKHIDQDCVMACIKNKNWSEDDDYEGLSGSEILDFVRWDHSIFYAWSTRTLDRRLRRYQTFYSDKNVTLDDVCQT